ncbi:hypothetical protein EVAR_69994_1 [Eumeta japonica]|uniref:Uncharacterized protein n=1 Tax=Eumeta variegata TaxID=151549 RepID=A0A4C2A5Z2_EUMVA|nr:hypothetical protein EVAR_69994_1 [Eumeta japonica]
MNCQVAIVYLGGVLVFVDVDPSPPFEEQDLRKIRSKERLRSEKNNHAKFQDNRKYSFGDVVESSSVELYDRSPSRCVPTGRDSMSFDTPNTASPAPGIMASLGDGGGFPDVIRFGAGYGRPLTARPAPAL